jgi:hypothetical protein
MKSFALFVVALFLCGTAMADESSRQVTIAKIMEAQGLQEMFQQQLDQSKDSAGEVGKDLVKKLLKESGAPDGQENPQLTEVFRLYLERCATMFSAKEYVDIWATFYGKNLSDSDLEQILAYYQSPIGKKDVLASKTAMVGFSQTMMRETQKRLNASIAQLMTDIKKAMEKRN